MTAEEQDVLDVLMDKNYILLYQRPGFIKRSSRLTQKEAQVLMKRENKKYKGCLPFTIGYVHVAPHHLKLDIWGDTDAASLLSEKYKWDGTF